MIHHSHKTNFATKSARKTLTSDIDDHQGEEAVVQLRGIRSATMF